MSRVFVADDTTLGRTVVVKVLSPELTAGVNIDRFKREIRVAARLQHPHIVPVLQSGETNGLPYFTMPFVEGRVAARAARTQRARSRLAMRSRFSATWQRPWSMPMRATSCTGTSSRTTCCSPATRPWSLTSASPRRSRLPRRQPSGATLTQAGTSLGTPAYMAPEQAAADPATDHRADIYAFGILAYELLAGQPPFAGRTPQKLLAAQLGERPTPIETVRADVPPAFDRARHALLGEERRRSTADVPPRSCARSIQSRRAAASDRPPGCSWAGERRCETHFSFAARHFSSSRSPLASRPTRSGSPIGCSPAPSSSCCSGSR